MDLASRKETFIFLVVLIGCSQASSPYVSTGCPKSFTSINEDFNGTICRFQITDSDSGDAITVRPANDFTAQYFNIVYNEGQNTVWVNLTVKKPLDRETLGGLEKIVLSITDKQHNEITYQHTVYISDINDNHPKFQHLPYTLEIDERPCNTSTVYKKIYATDDDSNDNARIRYSMEPKAQSLESQRKYNATFSIDPITGQVSLKQCLDYESNSYYQFIVIAKDSGPNGGLNTTAEFIVRVQDVQDTAPFFTGIPYRATINENIDRGTSIKRLNAEDGDPGVSNKVKYSITDSSCGAIFNIDSLSGNITTAAAIDRDAGKIKQESGNCIITVLAKEINKTGQKQCGNTTATTSVTVSVKDMDDNPPSFSSKSYTASIPENTPKGVPLNLTQAISVTDIDQANNAKMKITLKYPNNSACDDFSASPSEVHGSGTVLILVENTNLLDYETLERITIKVVATDTANSSHSDEAVINIDISDVNDNNPKFRHTQFTLKVDENSQNGTNISRITGTDADISSQYNKLTYSISGGNRRFIVDSNTGDILVNCSNCTAELDREKQNIYYMTYTAKDVDRRSDSASLVVQLLDVNDETPTFLSSSYKVIADENDKKYINKTPIIQVEAHDNDKEGTNNSAIVFDISTTSVKDFQNNLTIKHESGKIYLKSPLDYEKLVNTSGVINITVQASDMGHPRRSSSVIVTLNVQDVNDNRPMFNDSLYHADIMENATSNETHYTPVEQVFATDNDGTDRNKDLNYIIISGGSDRFTINASSGLVSVQRGAKFDRETVPDYNLTIIAIDQGYPPETGTTTMSIDVTDVNDEPPQFSLKEYYASVKENTTPSSIVKHCPASDADKNSLLEYSITNFEGSDENGMEVNQSLFFNYFGINATNGMVYVHGNMDRETAEKITLSIMVKDKAAFDPKPQNDTAKLTITLEDVNDNDPEFKNASYAFSVIENARNGTILGSIMATDIDVNRTITYTMVQEGRNTSGSFKIDPNSGVLSKTGYLDRETNDMVYLQVTATDSGVPPRNSSIGVNVTVVDFNDNPPEFTNFTRSIQLEENSRKGTRVIRVNATDKDEGPNKRVIYSMDEDDHFTINGTTGIISVVQSPDREMKDTFKLHIIAKDNPVDKKEQKSTDTTVTVIIEDINDNSPIFAQTIYHGTIEETKDVGTSITTVTAADKDKGNNSTITYQINDSLNSSLFSIDKDTGSIFVNSSLTDKIGIYNLTIIAYDHGNPRLNGTADVQIEVTDVNRHNPVITNIPHGNLIRIYECATVGSKFHAFTYTDGDFSSDNRLASFRIISDRNLSIAFNITEAGELEITNKLDVNKKSTYKFSIQATDHGKPPLSSDVVPITVEVLDVNDHLPSFDKPEVTWSIRENTTYNGSIGKVTAHDKDTDSKMCYSIIKSNWTDHFNISTTSGEIFNVKKLDREATTSISFIVNVTDCSLQVNTTYCDTSKTHEILKVQEETRDTIEVVIDVTDIDDNPPVFKQKNLATGMRRNTEANTELELSLRNNSYISDADSPQNGVLSWTFSNYGNITISPELQRSNIKANSGAKSCDDNIHHIFCVTKNGTIVNNKFFSEDLSGYFILTVMVADKAGSDTANITIYLISDTQIVTMIIRDNKEYVSSIKDNLLSQLSGILGYSAVFDSLQDHKENGGINPQKSDLKFHVVEKESQAVLSGKDAIELFDKQANNQQMIGLQNTFHVDRVTQQNMVETDADAGSKKLTFILVAVSVAEALIITIIIFLALSARNKFRRKLKAANINTPDMEMHVHGQKEVAIPGSNLYSKQNNPLLNADIDPVVKEANVDDDSIASSDDINLDENVVDDQNTVYDRMEEKEATLDMYNDDTFHSVSSEDLLNATLNLHALRKSRESLDKIDGDDDYLHESHYSPNTAAAFINEAFTEDLESTEI